MAFRGPCKKNMTSRSTLSKFDSSWSVSSFFPRASAEPEPPSADIPVPTAACPPAPADSDEVLVRNARAGSRFAEERLYRKHSAEVFQLALRLLRSHEDAADVTQDAFVQALGDLASLREPSAFRPWVRRIAVRMVHRRFRRRKMLRAFGLDGGASDVPLEDLADSSASSEARTELRLLDRAIETVGITERTAWMLRQVHGLALDEVAQACGCSLATAKRRIAVTEAAVTRHVEGIR